MKSTNSEQPFVSVIMPTYNHAKFIGKAIDSVLNQTYMNLELIIIDNYSEDDTEKIVDSYDDNRIICLKFRNNGIIAASRNHGIKNSHGDYIAFLDSDDIWLPSKLEKQVKQLHTHEEICLSYVLYSFMFENGSIQGVFPKTKNRFRGNIFKSLYLKSIIPNSGVMVRSKVFEELGLLDENSNLVAAEDYDMWLRIAKVKIIDYVDEGPLLLIRIREGSISQGLISKWRKMFFVAKKYAPYVKKILFIRKILLSSIYLLHECYADLK